MSLMISCSLFGAYEILLQVSAIDVQMNNMVVHITIYVRIEDLAGFIIEGEK